MAAPADIRGKDLAAAKFDRTTTCNQSLLHTRLKAFMTSSIEPQIGTRTTMLQQHFADPIGFSTTGGPAINQVCCLGPNLTRAFPAKANVKNGNDSHYGQHMALVPVTSIQIYNVQAALVPEAG